jgi:hypothetical protein
MKQWINLILNGKSSAVARDRKKVLTVPVHGHNQFDKCAHVAS